MRLDRENTGKLKMKFEGGTCYERERIQIRHVGLKK